MDPLHAAEIPLQINADRDTDTRLIFLDTRQGILCT